MTDPPLLIYADTIRTTRTDPRPGPRHALRADARPERRTRVNQEDLTGDDWMAVNTTKDDPQGRDADLPPPSQDPTTVPATVIDETGAPA